MFKLNTDHWQSRVSSSLCRCFILSFAHRRCGSPPCQPILHMLKIELPNLPRHLQTIQTIQVTKWDQVRSCEINIFVNKLLEAVRLQMLSHPLHFACSPGTTRTFAGLVCDIAETSRWRAGCRPANEAFNAWLSGPTSHLVQFFGCSALYVLFDEVEVRHGGQFNFPLLVWVRT